MNEVKIVPVGRDEYLVTKNDVPQTGPLRQQEARKVAQALSDTKPPRNHAMATIIVCTVIGSIIVGFLSGWDVNIMLFAAGGSFLFGTAMAFWATRGE